MYGYNLFICCMIFVSLVGYGSSCWVGGAPALGYFKVNISNKWYGWTWTNNHTRGASHFVVWPILSWEWLVWDHQTLVSHTYIALEDKGHLLVITGYKWDYTLYNWGFVSTYKWYFGPQLQPLQHLNFKAKSGIFRIKSSASKPTKWDPYCQ